MNIRVYLTTLLLFLFVQSLSAQELSVKSFRLLENDLTANTHATMVKDKNGEVAALIKVVTTEQGFAFDGGMTGIVLTKQGTGEVWVYVPHGIKRINIQHQQFGVLRDYYFPIPIEKARTYELILSTPTSPTDTRKGWLELIYSPMEANVFIDGISFPTIGNGSLMTILNYGSHSYQVAAEGFATQEGIFNIDNTKTSLNVKLSELPPPVLQDTSYIAPQEQTDSIPQYAIPNNENQRFKFGIVAGLNSNMPSNHGIDYAAHRFSLGGQIGAKCEIGLPSTSKGLFLDLGAQLTLPISRVNDFYAEDYQEWGYGYTIPYYLTIPMHLGYRFNYNDYLKLFCSAGLYYSYLIGGTFTFKMHDSGMNVTANLRPYLEDCYETFDYGVGLRLGAELNNRWQVSIGYDVGLHNIGYAGAYHYDINPNINLRNNVLNVSCTYILSQSQRNLRSHVATDETFTTDKEASLAKNKLQNISRWYIQDQLGVQHTKSEIAFNELNSPNAQLGIGYNFNKSWGTRVTLNGWQSKAGWETGNGVLHKWAWNYISPVVDVTANLSNWILGYNPNRLVNFGVFAGLGTNIAFCNDGAATANEQIRAEYNFTKREGLRNLWSGTKGFFTGRAGANVDFRIANNYSISLELQANATDDQYDSKRSGNPDWYINALLGLKYTF